MQLKAKITDLKAELRENKSRKAETDGEIALLKGRIREIEAAREVELGPGEIKASTSNVVKDLEDELKVERSRRTQLEGDIALLKGEIAIFQVREKSKSKSESAAKSTPIVSDTKFEGLQIIEGIGPKIEQILHNGGIHSLKELSETSVSLLKSLLDRAGSRYRLAKPDTWPVQANLAAEGRWEELKAYQSILKGGK